MTPSDAGSSNPGLTSGPPDAPAISPAANRDANTFRFIRMFLLDIIVPVTQSPFYLKITMVPFGRMYSAPAP